MQDRDPTLSRHVPRWISLLLLLRAQPCLMRTQEQNDETFGTDRSPLPARNDKELYYHHIAVSRTRGRCLLGERLLTAVNNEQCLLFRKANELVGSLLPSRHKSARLAVSCTSVLRHMSLSICAVASQRLGVEVTTINSHTFYIESGLTYSLRLTNLLCHSKYGNSE